MGCTRWSHKFCLFICSSIFVFFCSHVVILTLIGSFSTNLFDETEHVLFFQNLIKLIWSNKNVSHFAVYIINLIKLIWQCISGLITFLKKYRSSHQRCRSNHQRCSIKKIVLKFLETKKTPVLKPVLIKLQALTLQVFLKKRLQHKCFPMEFTKLLGTPILKNISKRLLLEVYKKAVIKNFAIFTGRR